LTTEEGAFIDGKITMVGHESSNAPDALLNEAEKPATIENLQQEMHDAAEQADESFNEPDEPTAPEVESEDTPTTPIP
jgi:hypothetical protein